MAITLCAIVAFAISLVLTMRPILLHPRHAYLPLRVLIGVIVLLACIAFPVFYYGLDNFWLGWGIAVGGALIAWASASRVVTLMRAREDLSVEEQAAADEAAGSLSDHIAKAIVFACGSAAMLAKLFS